MLKYSSLLLISFLLSITPIMAQENEFDCSVYPESQLQVGRLAHFTVDPTNITFYSGDPHYILFGMFESRFRGEKLNGPVASEVFVQQGPVCMQKGYMWQIKLTTDTGGTLTYWIYEYSAGQSNLELISRRIPSLPMEEQESFMLSATSDPPLVDPESQLEFTSMGGELVESVLITPSGFQQVRA